MNRSSQTSNTITQLQNEVGLFQSKDVQNEQWRNLLNVGSLVDVNLDIPFTEESGWAQAEISGIDNDKISQTQFTYQERLDNFYENMLVDFIGSHCNYTRSTIISIIKKSSRIASVNDNYMKYASIALRVNCEKCEEKEWQNRKYFGYPNRYNQLVSVCSLQIRPFGSQTLKDDPLIHTAAFGSLDQVKQLVSQGEDVNQNTFFDETAFFMACYYNRLEIAEYLLQFEVNINQWIRYQLNPLIVSIYRNYPDIFKLLLKNGVSIDLQTDDDIVKEDIKQKFSQIETVIFAHQEWQRIKFNLKILDIALLQKQNKVNRQKENVKNNLIQDLAKINKNILFTVIEKYL
ncbi:ankyrin repeat [Stylonychia lemnae]|uniref:Ankyrin repeat n=1 Tax=Stylonychia lemnae TaxID=5949 RepID=A0A078BEA7_STYLE|nr:ankyrin repeat [Stylonychia lemnae]|eukprot:CDW91467.1 ankyrin repeat [Stylonychia lemnae]